jgi:beta-galactosidase GanA
VLLVLCLPVRVDSIGRLFCQREQFSRLFIPAFGIDEYCQAICDGERMKIRSALILTGAVCFFGGLSALNGAEPPRVRIENGAGQLVVKGQPFLILGGELGNSSAGTAAEAETVIPKLATMHFNTILVPVAWEQIEPKESSFDFSILDKWVATARSHNMHLVLLWFGSWKNAFSNYAPSWVKSDTKRFPRAESVDGKPLEILSTFSADTRRADSRAFAALMRHVRDTDSDQQTVLMVQVENEVGYLGPGRDRSAEADRLFAEAVPGALVKALTAKSIQLSPELAGHFNERGRTWREVFGDAADEAFMAWSYAFLY